MVRIIIECSEHDAKTLSDGYFTEPAPPKDWRPFCWIKPAIEKIHGQSCGAYQSGPECEQCLYRKSGAQE